MAASEALSGDYFRNEAGGNVSALIPLMPTASINRHSALL
jgi:hypothetical protein